MSAVLLGLVADALALAFAMSWMLRRFCSCAAPTPVKRQPPLVHVGAHHRQMRLGRRANASAARRPLQRRARGRAFGLRFCALAAALRAAVLGAVAGFAGTP